ncbi:MAG: GxxExxY protein [Candidatus Latescibacterota bacterium]
MGPGFLESVYEEALVLESKKRQIPHETKVRIPVHCKGQKLIGGSIADCVGFDKIVVEFKGIPKLTKIEEAQIINYLKATGTKVGLLIDFGSHGRLDWRRYIRTERNDAFLREP